MRFENNPPEADDPAASSAPPPPPPPPPPPAPPSAPSSAAPEAARRRRAARSWSTPSVAAERTAFERPISERDWVGNAEPAAGTSDGATDVGALAALVDELRGELSTLRAAVESGGDRQESLVTGAELAASIQALGDTLGTGLATLLTEHRNLLARDLDKAADRILEELGQRLRTTGTQSVDSIEERMRHVTTKGLRELTEQLEVRLERIEGDVGGLRAVMLEIPDQTAVVTRLDELADTIGSARTREAQRVSPAMTQALERAVSGPVEQLEEAISAVVDSVREVLEERLPEEVPDYPDTGMIEALTTEVVALRRRISLRPETTEAVDGAAPAREPSIRLDATPAAEEPAVKVPVAKQPAVKKPPARKRTARLAAKATPAKAAPAKVTPAKRTPRAR